MASITPTIYWAINETELQLSNSSISGTYSGSFAGDTEFTSSSQPWHNYKSTIESVNILSNISIGSGKYFFYDLRNCEEIKNIDRLDVSNVTNMSYMFYYCGYSNPNFVLDLSNFDTSKVGNMSYMFYGCSTLKTIYVSEQFTTSSVTSSTDMFNYCTSLVGAVPYDSSRVDASMANYKTGYFTYLDPRPITPILPDLLDISPNVHQLSFLEEVQSTASGLVLGRKPNKHTDILINLGNSPDDIELYTILTELGWLDDLDPGNHPGDPLFPLDDLYPSDTLYPN